MMPNGDPRDRFFYPTLTLMMESYIMLQDGNQIHHLPWRRVYARISTGRDVEIVKISTCTGTSKKPKCTCP